MGKNIENRAVKLLFSYIRETTIKNQYELADALELNQSSVSRLCRGLMAPSTHTINKVEKLTGKPFHQLCQEVLKIYGYRTAGTEETLHTRPGKNMHA
jgi:hypothetical protein